MGRARCGAVGASLITLGPEHAASRAARRGYDAWVKLFRAHAHYPWFVDRFHVSTRATTTSIAAEEVMASPRRDGVLPG